jgi:hypothetical protein
MASSLNIMLTILLQAPLVRTTTITPRPSARSLSAAQPQVAASSAVGVLRQARHLAGSERAPPIHRLGLEAVLALARACLEAQTSLPSVAAQLPPLVVDCLAAETLAVVLVPPTPQEALAVVRQVDSARQRAMHPTTVPRVRPSRPTLKRTELPQRSTTRPSPSSSRTQTTLSKS